MAFMKGKKGLIMGVANERSIAWGMAEALHKEGAELAFTYQGDAFGKRVKPLAEGIGADIVVDCDVSNEDSLDNLFTVLKEKWGEIDFIVHAIAYSNKDELAGRYVETSLENFHQTMHISCYSFTSIMRRAKEIMPSGGSGPMRTLAGAVIGGARTTLKYNTVTSPLRRSVELEELGGTGLYLLSDLSSAVTGEIHYVDCGFNAVGMPPHEGLKEF